jgi:hypothetical protein
VDASKCPANPEEVAEAYVMGTLQKERVIAFEDHYVTCSQCATVLQKTVEYVEAMRGVEEGAHGLALMERERLLRFQRVAIRQDVAARAEYQKGGVPPGVNGCTFRTVLDHCRSCYSDARP